MQKDELNAALRQFVKDKLTPTQEDRDFVSTVYDSFRQLLNDACIQIGSYPRFTAIRPLHDLDILYRLFADSCGRDSGFTGHINLPGCEMRLRNHNENPVHIPLAVACALQDGRL